MTTIVSAWITPHLNTHCSISPGGSRFSYPGRRHSLMTWSELKLGSHNNGADTTLAGNYAMTISRASGENSWSLFPVDQVPEGNKRGRENHGCCSIFKNNHLDKSRSHTSLRSKSKWRFDCICVSLKKQWNWWWAAWCTATNTCSVDKVWVRHHTLFIISLYFIAGLVSFQQKTSPWAWLVIFLIYICTVKRRQKGSSLLYIMICWLGGVLLLTSHQSS